MLTYITGNFKHFSSTYLIQRYRNLFNQTSFSCHLYLCTVNIISDGISLMKPVQQNAESSHTNQTN